MLADDEAFVQLGRRVRPEDVAGLTRRASVPEVTPVNQVHRVLAHPSQTSILELVPKRPEFRRCRGGGTDKKENWGDPWCHLNRERCPAGDQAVRIILRCACHIGPLIGRHRPIAQQGVIVHGP